jgi:hypothetical protein
MYHLGNWRQPYGCPNCDERFVAYRLWKEHRETEACR